MIARLIIALFFMSYYCISFGSAPYEDEIQSIAIKYAGGSSISLECKKLVCDVNIVADGKRLSFSPDDLKGYPVPSLPVMFTKNFDADELSFEVELHCEASGFDTSYKGPCRGSYRVLKGKVVKGLKYMPGSGRKGTEIVY